MLLNISQDLCKHLEYLVDNTDEVVGNFAAISIEFLESGINNKTFSSAAQKLGVGSDVIENAVRGLMQLFTEGSKFMLNENDFFDSLLLIGFSKQICEKLTDLYLTHHRKNKMVLSKAVPSLPVYGNFEWRFNVKVASRSLHNQIVPVIYLRLSVFDGKDHKTHVLQTDVRNLVHVTNVLEGALNEMKSNHCRRIIRNVK